MTQEQNSLPPEEGIQSGSSKPTRKGFHRYFHVSKADGYISAFVAIIFFGIGFIALFNLFGVEEFKFISMMDAFQFAFLLGLFGMVSRMYYKLFEEKYDKEKS